MLDGKDTLICLDVPQSKTVLKEIERAKMLDTLLAFTEKQLQLCEQVVKNDSIAFVNYEQIVENCEGVVRIRETQIKEKDAQISAANAEMRRQKRRKNVAIIAGSVGTGIMGYLWLTK